MVCDFLSAIDMKNLQTNKIPNLTKYNLQTSSQ
nr:MAG TPA: hypothetical protein [Crassvirales sp.]